MTGGITRLIAGIMDDATFAGLTASAGLAASLLGFAAAQGASRDLLLSESGIDASRLGDPDARVPLARYVALMRAAKVLTGDPALGLHFGAGDEMAEFSVVGLVTNACATMGEAIEQLNRYGQLVIEVARDGPGRFRLKDRAGGTWAIDTRRDPNTFPELTESTFARMTAGALRKFGRSSAKLVRVTHPAPDHASAYAEVFGAPVEFEAARNEMLINPDWLAMPVGLAPRYAFGILARHADTLLAELEASHSLAGRVEAALMPLLHKGAPGIAAVARQMGMSRATLYRRLRAEGTSFDRLLGGLRRRLALDYLAAGKVSIGEAAYLSGFSDPAAFSRAVKRWTGQSPSALRGALPTR
jgi:AraC-like DNA-binding protein